MNDFESYMKDLWKSHASSFDNMTDEQIEYETQCMQRNLDEAEEWLEALASWEAAGRPRTVKV